MSEPAPDEQRGNLVTSVIGTTALVVAVVALPVVGGLWYLKHQFTGGGPPSCDREPVELEWLEREQGWSRSTQFDLIGDPQKVQVDVQLAPDGGVLDFGSTVYAIRAGERPPDRITDTTATTVPFGGVTVGHGREAVNEQVVLDAGAWELVTSGSPGPAEVRWPC